MPVLPQPAPFPARFSAAAAVRAVIAAACDESGIGRDVRLRVELALEELFANTIHHGYGGECDRPVWIAVRGNADGIEVEYQDEGPAFDPFSAAAVPAEAALAPQFLGGVGCLLVRNLASRRGYRRVGSRNRIMLFFAREAAPG